MCSRYELLATFESLVAATTLQVPPTDDEARKSRAFERGDIRPTNLGAVIGPGGQLAWLPWGLAVDWQSQPVINARSETLDQKPTFRPLLEQRCIVPASGYFEWRKEGGAKIKTRIAVAGHDVFAFAGLVGDGRFTIVTCVPAPSIAHIHDRMPVILPRAAQDLWLDPARRFQDVKHVLTPFAANLKSEELAAPPARQGELAF